MFILDLCRVRVEGEDDTTLVYSNTDFPVLLHCLILFSKLQLTVSGQQADAGTHSKRHFLTVGFLRAPGEKWIFEEDEQIG